jgi:hypothetical protein
MKRWFFVSVLSLIVVGASDAQAVSLGVGFAVTVEPIVGFEHVEKLTPAPHVKNRLIYGARVIAGIPIVSGELEYTRGTDREVFGDLGLSITETADRGKLGARSSYDLGELLRFHLRAGGQVSKISREQTQGGVTTTTTENPVVKPYAGTGLTVRLAQALSASAEVVVVVNDLQDLSKNEYQTTAGFQVRFP